MTKPPIIYVRIAPYTPRDARNWWQKLWNMPNPLTPLGPTPEQAGLKPDVAYRLLTINDYSNEAEAYFAIINEQGMLFYLSNRYFRVVALVQEMVPLNVVGLDMINISLKPQTDQPVVVSRKKEGQAN